MYDSNSHYNTRSNHAKQVEQRESRSAIFPDEKNFSTSRNSSKATFIAARDN